MPGFLWTMFYSILYNSFSCLRACLCCTRRPSSWMSGPLYEATSPHAGLLSVSRLGRKVSNFWSWKRSRNSAPRRFGVDHSPSPVQAVVPQQMHILGAFPADCLEQGNGFDELGLGQSRGWRLRRADLDADQSGQTQGAVKRETLRSPACGLVASYSGRSSKTKGVLVQQRQARRHENELYNTIEHCPTKKPAFHRSF